MIIAQAQFPAAYNQLEPVRQFVEHSTERYGFASDVIYSLIWSITEIVTNVVEHGFKGQGGFVEIILRQEGSDFIMQVCDEAPVFDPLAAPEPDITLPLEERPLGGLGLFVTKKMMDSFSHRVTETGGNEITMIKRGIIELISQEETTNGTDS